MMTPDTVFKDKTNEEAAHLQGSNIGASKSITPKAPSLDEVRKILKDYLAQYPDTLDYYNMINHMCTVGLRKTDTKDQFYKLIEIYFSSIKQKLKSDEEAQELLKVKKAIEPMQILLDDFIKSSKVENDYFRAGLAALLVNIL